MYGTPTLRLREVAFIDAGAKSLVELYIKAFVVCKALVVGSYVFLECLTAVE